MAGLEVCVSQSAPQDPGGDPRWWHVTPPSSLCEIPLRMDPLPRRPSTPQNPRTQGLLVHLASTKEHRLTAQGTSHPWTLDITIIHLLAPSSTNLTASAQFPSTSVTSRFPLPLGPRQRGADDERSPIRPADDVAVGGSASGTARVSLPRGRVPPIGRVVFLGPGIPLGLPVGGFVTVWWIC